MTITYSPYRVLTLTAKDYMEPLLKDERTFGHLQPISGLTLTTKAYTEALLKDGSALDGILTAYSGSSS